MVKLFHLMIPKAVAVVMDMAVKQERIGNSQSALTWMNLAQRIESGSYSSEKQVAKLVQDYPFLSRYRI